MKAILSMAALVALAALSACSSSNSSAPASVSRSAARSISTAAPVANLPPIDPCTLATQSEASEAAGGQVGPGKSGMWAGRMRCHFQNSDDTREVDVNLMTPADIEGFAPGSTQPIPGIGDRAFFAPTNGNIWIQKGQRVVAIVIEMTNPKSPYAPQSIRSVTPAAEKFSKIVAGRM